MGCLIVPHRGTPLTPPPWVPGARPHGLLDLLSNASARESDLGVRIAPLDRVDAVAMIRELRSLPLLEGSGGWPRSDLHALADTRVVCSQLPFRYLDVAEIDLNPVFAFPWGF